MSKGATWKKIDFHSHSPASFDFQFESLTPDQAYKRWINDYNESEIDGVVITDHNSFDGYFEILSIVKKFDDINLDFELIPGIELTVSGDYHLLALFDGNKFCPDFGAKFLNKIDYNGQRGQSAEPCTKSISDVCKIILEMGGVVIPAHANDAKGVFQSTITNNHLLDNSLFNAVEITTSDAYEELLNKKYKKYQCIGVVGSDSHSYSGDDEFRKRGKVYTWVKLEQPNFDGILSALQDGRTSFVPYYKKSPVQNKSGIIKKLRVRNKGVEQEFNFNADLNSLIGGRGAGKSTVVELIRLALGKYDDLINRDPNKDWFSPHNKGHNKFWDSDTNIEIDFEKESGVLYKVIWNGSNPEESEIYSCNPITGELEKEPGNVRERFPVDIFSQKQIYEISEDPYSLLNIIDGFSRKPLDEALKEKREIEFRISAATKILNDNISKKQRKEEISGSIKDLENDLNQIIVSFPPQKMENYKNLNESIQSANEFGKVASQLVSSLEKLLSDNEHLNGFVAKQTFFINGIEEKWEEEQTFREEVLKLFSELSSVKDKLSTLIEDWNCITDKDPRLILKKDYRLVPDFGSIGFMPSEQRKIEEELTIRKSELNDINNSLADESQLTTEVVDLMKNLDRNRRKLFGIRLDSSRKLCRNTSLDIEIDFCGDVLNVPNEFREIFNQPVSFDSIFSLDHDIFAPLKGSGDILERINKVKDNWLKILQKADDAIGIHATLANNLSKLDILSTRNKIYKWYPADSIKIFFKPDGANQRINITNGSPGQKTAALLTLILRNNANPLILDQPEDDLDNNLITALLVNTAHKRKHERQMLVATHNANFVINANSENIFVLKYGYDGQIPIIDVNGFIQSQDVRNQVCSIMEGGELALRRRFVKLLGAI